MVKEGEQARLYGYGVWLISTLPLEAGELIFLENALGVDEIERTCAWRPNLSRSVILCMPSRILRQRRESYCDEKCAEWSLGVVGICEYIESTRCFYASLLLQLDYPCLSTAHFCESAPPCSDCEMWHIDKNCELHERVDVQLQNDIVLKFSQVVDCRGTVELIWSHSHYENNVPFPSALYQSLCHEGRRLSESKAMYEKQAKVLEVFEVQNDEFAERSTHHKRRKFDTSQQLILCKKYYCTQRLHEAFPWPSWEKYRMARRKWSSMIEMAIWCTSPLPPLPSWNILQFCW